MTHYPFMWVFANYVVAEQPSMAQLAWIIPVSTIALVALAYVVMQTIDTPVRSYLKTKLKDRKLG